jgi:hypothetical protein
MAGYYENKDKGACWEAWYDNNNDAQSDYVMNQAYWMRPGVPECRNNSLGATCSFYGPLNVPRTTQESFLQGRGQILSSKCPDCEVIYLPESVFPPANPANSTYACENNALTPAQTKQKKSCYNVMETDISQYQMMPGAWQPGYMGYNVMCDMNILDRQNGAADYRAAPRTAFEKMNNYGNYRTIQNKTARNEQQLTKTAAA